MSKNFDDFVRFMRDDEDFAKRYEAAFDALARKIEDSGPAVGAYKAYRMIANKELLLVLEAYHNWLNR